MAECSPSKEVDHVEPSRVVGREGEAGGLAEIVKIGASSSLGRDRGIKVSLTPLIGEESKASKGKEASSGGTDDDRRVEGSLGLNDGDTS